MKRIICLTFLTLLFYSCGDSKKNVVTQDRVSLQESATLPLSEDVIKDAGNKALSALKNEDYKALSKFFSEKNGVLFSPYGHIEPAHAKVLKAKDFLESIQKNWILTWGNYDGTGDPIQLTVKEYLSKFVYNADYLNAERIAINETIGQGNSLNNLQEIFPSAEFIEYHFNGFDTKYQGMDWRSLRLVFENEHGKLRLIAIVHDQWTI